MAVVKSPKNTKRKNLWMKSFYKTVSTNTINYVSKSNKPFKSKPKK